MPFQTQDPVPFYHPVAPEVPVPHQMPQGDLIGGNIVAAFTQRAIASEKAQLDQQQNLQNADLDAQKLDLAKTNSANDFQLKKILYGSYQTNADANYQRATRATKSLMDDTQQKQMIQDKLLQYNDKVKQEPEFKQFTDVKNWDEDPVGTNAAFLRFQDNHRSDVMSVASDTIHQFGRLADQQKIPYHDGAVFVPAHNVTVIKNDIPQTTKVDGAFDYTGSSRKDVPVWQIAKSYAETKEGSPERQKILWGLMAAGQDKIAESLIQTGTEPTTVDDPKHPGQKIPTTRDVLVHKRVIGVSERAQKILDAAGKTDFSRGTDQTPEIFTEKYKSKQPLGIDYNNPDQSGPTLPEPDLPPLQGTEPTSSIGAPTNTDVTLSHAKAALAANPQARDEIVKRLAGMQIDPKLLFA